MCSGYVTQVSEPWPVGLLFYYIKVTTVVPYSVILFVERGPDNVELVSNANQIADSTWDRLFVSVAY